VLANFRGALRPQGLLYVTVELPDQQDLDRVYAQAVADGLPVVPGEHTALGGGYHYYSPLDQVAAWLRDAGFQQLTNAYGDEYCHLLMVAGGR
jgi:hypothetical protein